MKKYNPRTYSSYKESVNAAKARIRKETLANLNRDEVITMYLPLVENLARKFSTSHQASGVMSLNDMIQEGSIGLIMSYDTIKWDKIKESPDPERTIRSFFSKRIKGAIRRAIDKNRGDIRIPEHKLNEIRKDNGKDQKMVAMFFNSIFLSIDAQPTDDENSMYQIPDKSEPYNIQLLNIYLVGLLRKHLTDKEFEVLRLSYGLDCEKHSAKDIAQHLNITGASDYVRVSELKKQAVQKLIDNVDHSQVLDYL